LVRRPILNSGNRTVGLTLRLEEITLQGDCIMWLISHNSRQLNE